MIITPYTYDDALIETARNAHQPQFAVYRFPEQAVVLGRGSQPELELHGARCQHDQIPIRRRQGGGCAVVLDSGNVIVSLTLPVTGLGDNPRYFAAITAWLIDALATIGFPGISTDGVSDLVLGNRKIAGACIWRSKDLLYYSASVLVAAELPLIDRYLRHPPREPLYRAKRPHAEFITNLASRFPSCSPKSVTERLQHTLQLQHLFWQIQHTFAKSP